MTTRKWVKRIGLGLALALVLGGIWAAANATALRAYVAARQLRGAATDEERGRAADRLLALGDHGLARLVECIRTGDGPSRAAAVAAIDRHVNSLPANDPWAAAAADRLLAAAQTGEDSGQRAILELLPAVLKRAGSAYAAKARGAVAAGLTLADPAARLAAVRVALAPEVNMRAELLPLLGDPDAAVRRAALVAVAVDERGKALMADEDLFRWLHDPDEGVRKICHDALVSRDRTEAQIALGRRLTNPDPGERLKLLLDLRYDDDVADPEPWLERLSRDREPAVRAGAARVAVEVSGDRRLSCPAWVERVATADADPTVRLIAGYFRSVPMRTATGELRPAGGP